MSLPTTQEIMDKLDDIHNQVIEIQNEMPEPVGKFKRFMTRYHYVLMIILYVIGYHSHKWHIIDRIISIMP